MVIFRHGEPGWPPDKPEPGTWWHVHSSAGWSAMIVCPKCGGEAPLDHDIAADGTITPSLVCPYDPCDFHEWGRLDGWEVPPPPQELKGAVEVELGSIFEIPLLEALAKIYTPEEVATWSRSPQPLLGGAIPRDLVQTEEGRARLLMVIGSIVDGVYL